MNCLKSALNQVNDSRRDNNISRVQGDFAREKRTLRKGRGWK